jgi:disulfide bond formation protein DsbB
MNWFKKYALYIAWVVALVATLGSLYFQYVMHFPPCVLCWYQRIAMYPLVVIIPIGIVKKDTVLPLYLMAMGVIGSLIGLYHNLLYYKIIPESLAPCIAGFSCTTKFIEWFGFVTIPLLSLVALIIITVCGFAAYKGAQHDQRS